MKAKFIHILIITLTCFVICSYAQDNNQADSEIKWTRIETDEKDISVVFPPNFIVDAEKREYGQRFNIVGFQNDVRMSFTVYKINNAKQNFQVRNPPNDMNLSTFEKNGIKGSRLTSIETAKIYKETISLKNGDNNYVISLATDNKNRSEVERFLFSIKLKGDNLFVAPTDKQYPEESVSISSLKTNSEVIEAYGRKMEKKKGNVIKEISSIAEEFISYQNYSRPPIILHRPSPKFNPPIDQSNRIKSYSVRLKLKLLADGQVGDIKILSISDEDFTNACVESARKIKFIPAQIDGINADSVNIVEYTVAIFTVTTTTTTIIPGLKTF